MKTLILIDGQKLGNEVNTVWDDTNKAVKEDKESLLGKSLLRTTYEKTGIDGSKQNAYLFQSKDERVNFVGFIYCPKEKGQGHDDLQIISLPKFCYSLGKAGVEKALPLANKISLLFYRYRKYIEKKDSLFKQCISDSGNINFQFEKLRDLYLQYGLYTEKAVVHASKGRIDWHATINTYYPYIINGAPIYLNTVKKRSVDIENEVTEIEKGLLNLFYTSLGNAMPFPDCCLEKEDYQKNQQKYIRRLEDERRLVHLDSDLATIDAMLEILKGIVADVDSDRAASIFAVASFEIVFEKLVSDFFGNQLVNDWEWPDWNEKKASTFSLRRINEVGQTISWSVKINNSSTVSNYKNFDTLWGSEKGNKWDSKKDSIVPDAIFTEKKNVFILDAKYHKWYVDSDTGLIRYLPSQNADIYKQYYYAEVMRNFIKASNSNLKNYLVKNVFVLPMHAGEELKDGYLVCAGHNQRGANNRATQKIFLIFVDTFKMMDAIIQEKNDVKAHRSKLAFELQNYMNYIARKQAKDI